MCHVHPSSYEPRAERKKAYLAGGRAEIRKDILLFFFFVHTLYSLIYFDESVLFLKFKGKKLQIMYTSWRLIYTSYNYHLQASDTLMVTICPWLLDFFENIKILQFLFCLIFPHREWPECTKGSGRCQTWLRAPKPPQPTPDLMLRVLLSCPGSTAHIHRGIFSLLWLACSNSNALPSWKLILFF